MSWREGKKIQYVSDDMARTFLTIEGNDFSNSSYGVFVTNSSKDDRALESLKSLAQAALQAGVVKFTDVASILNSESIVKVRKQLERSEQEAEQRGQEAQQAEQQAAQQAAQMLNKWKLKKKWLKKIEKMLVQHKTTKLKSKLL